MSNETPPSTLSTVAKHEKLDAKSDASTTVTMSPESTHSTDAKTLDQSIETALNCRYFNTLHGFNSWNGGGHIILGIITWSNYVDPTNQIKWGKLPEPEAETVNEWFREAFPSLQTFACVGYAMGRDFIKWPIAHRDAAGLAIEFIRSKGYRIQLQTKLMVEFASKQDPTDFSYIPFSKEAAERLVVRDNMPYLKKGWFHIYQSQSDVMSDERLWCTAEGKAFARLLHAHFKRTLSALVLPDTGLVECSYDFPTIGSVISAHSPAKC